MGLFRLRDLHAVDLRGRAEVQGQLAGVVLHMPMIVKVLLECKKDYD